MSHTDQNQARLFSGFPGVLFYPVSLAPGDSLGAAIYRYVHVATTPIPEPPGTSLVAAGGGLLAGGLFLGRRVWNRSSRA